MATMLRRGYRWLENAWTLKDVEGRSKVGERLWWEMVKNILSPSDEKIVVLSRVNIAVFTMRRTVDHGFSREKTMGSLAGTAGTPRNASGGCVTEHGAGDAQSKLANARAVWGGHVDRLIAPVMQAPTIWSGQ